MLIKLCIRTTHNFRSRSTADFFFSSFLLFPQQRGRRRRCICTVKDFASVRAPRKKNVFINFIFIVV